MTGPRSASPLASSGADWTGADIGGLHDLAATLRGYLPGIAGVAAALNQEVAQRRPELLLLPYPRPEP